MAKKTYRDIKSALPDIESEKVEILADELDRIQSLKVLWLSDGGKQLLSVLRDNCQASLRRLKNAVKDKPTLDELMGHVASYSANIDLLATLQDISTEEEISKQLDEAVKEAGRVLET